MTEPEKEEHSYYPHEKLIPITPQARRAGFICPAYVTPTIWKRACSWSGGQSRRQTNPDKRIFELLRSASDGLNKRLAGDPDDEEGFLYYRFKHFFWDRGRPTAKKMSSMKIGCRLFLNPETGKPWALLFDPDYDYENVLKKGESNDPDL